MRLTSSLEGSIAFKGKLDYAIEELGSRESGDWSAPFAGTQVHFQICVSSGHACRSKRLRIED